MTLAERTWWRRDPGLAGAAMRAALLPAEAVFRAAAALRGALYDRGALRAAVAPVPVVSVGNVAVGGTGKTPATIAIAERLAARGRAVAVLSRGHGAARRDPRVVSDGREVLLDAREGGDEPALIARRVPGVRVLCGPRRAALVPRALALGADVLLLDDGFQHRALARDLDVVVLDAADPAGNGRLLPAGPNREPLSALRRADLAWLSHADRADPAGLERLRALAREATGRAPVESRHLAVDVLDGALGESFGLDAVRGRRVALVSGIARPASFRRTAEALGAQVRVVVARADHHRRIGADLSRALRAAEGRRPPFDLVVTTEKDAVRVPPEVARHPALRVVRIAAEIAAGAAALDDSLDAALALGDARRAAPEAQG